MQFATYKYHTYKRRRKSAGEKYDAVSASEDLRPASRERYVVRNVLVSFPSINPVI